MDEGTLVGVLVSVLSRSKVRSHSSPGRPRTYIYDNGITIEPAVPHDSMWSPSACMLMLAQE